MSKIKYYVRLLIKTYLGVGIMVGIYQAKKQLDEFTRPNDNYRNKLMNNVIAIVIGSISGVLWPLTLAINWHDATRDPSRFYIIHHDPRDKNNMRPDMFR